MMQPETESDDRILKEMEDGRIKNERIRLQVQKGQKDQRYPEQINPVQKNPLQKNQIQKKNL